MRGHLLQLRLAGVQPPLASRCDHADQHLRIHRGQLGVVAPGLEHVAEDVLDLAGDVADQAGEGTGAGGGIGVAYQDAETIGVLLDVPEQLNRGHLELGHGVLALEQRGCHRQEPLDLPVYDDGIQPLLAAEVLVHDGLGHAGLGGNFLNGSAVQAALGEQSPADVQELLAAFFAGHAFAAASWRGCHRSIMVA